MFYWHGMGWGGWVVMIVAGIAFWGLAAGAVAAVVRALRNEPARPEQPRRALDVLDERFARGEIDEAEYRSRRDVLIQNGTDHRLTR